MVKGRNRKHEHNVLVLGCSRLGASLASLCSQREESVTIVDQNEAAFVKLSPNYDGLKACGNVTDMDDLSMVHVKEMDQIFVTTNDDCTNVMCALLLRECNEHAKIFVRLIDPERKQVMDGYAIETICLDDLWVERCSSVLQKESENTQILRR